MDDDKKNRRKSFFDNDDFFFDFGEMDDMINKMMGSFFSSDNFKMRGKPMVWGRTVRQGPDGKIRIEEFGNMKSEGGKPVVSEKREPLVDVINTKKDITITAELPGVNENEINIKTTGNHTVTISVDSKEKPYYKELELKDSLDMKSKKINFKNGILEIFLKKK
ncbi:MAG: archaeal heat shock protein Hsp20 [Candidatus Diapherotrites archaeon]